MEELPTGEHQNLVRRPQYKFNILSRREPYQGEEAIEAAHRHGTRPVPRTGTSNTTSKLN